MFAIDKARRALIALIKDCLSESGETEVETERVHVRNAVQESGNGLEGQNNTGDCKEESKRSQVSCCILAQRCCSFNTVQLQLLTLVNLTLFQILLCQHIILCVFERKRNKKMCF